MVVPYQGIRVLRSSVQQGSRVSVRALNQSPAINVPNGGNRAVMTRASMVPRAAQVGGEVRSVPSAHTVVYCGESETWSDWAASWICQNQEFCQRTNTESNGLLQAAKRITRKQPRAVRLFGQAHRAVIGDIYQGGRRKR